MIRGMVRVVVFNGLWSACPFFPSGKVIGGNREDGLYVWTFNNTKAGRIYVSLLDSLTQVPLTNTEIVIVETNDTLLTDFNGQIKWGALPGVYTLSVEVEGYLSESFTFEFTGCDALEVDVLLQEDIIESIFDSYKELPALSLSPNPSAGKIYLDFQSIDNGHVLEVYNKLGQKVYSQKINGLTTMDIDLGFLSRGVYHVVLMNQSSELIAGGRLLLISN